MGERSEEKEAHVVVDIPGGGGEEESTSSSAIGALKHHPLAEISQSPGHLLLLKLWQREEDLLGRRIAAGETLLDSTKREVFRLCCLFFAFHGLFLNLLFAGGNGGGAACGSYRRWWLPCCLSLMTSLALVSAVQARLWRFWAAARRVQRERVEARALARCVQELRMKGKSFDLCKVPVVGGGRRMKSAGEEMKWRTLRWCRRNVLIISLFCFTAAAVPPGSS
ncbi:unnamed protein product [Spirodela intermedia]|uniref:Uncharacterized protein n=1 Tax=Spirodela intermedia TaxID=51605 RepID=A0A7I8JQE0_SPIIN|nr:unnamed protein product [Spirodela intermedia]CAA6672387.1 unnamed protein product [Spirodela intermedia]